MLSVPCWKGRRRRRMALPLLNPLARMFVRFMGWEGRQSSSKFFSSWISNRTLSGWQAGFPFMARSQVKLSRRAALKKKTATAHPFICVLVNGPEPAETCGRVSASTAFCFMLFPLSLWRAFFQNLSWHLLKKFFFKQISRQQSHARIHWEESSALEGEYGGVGKRGKRNMMLSGQLFF